MAKKPQRYTWGGGGIPGFKNQDFMKKYMLNFDRKQTAEPWFEECKGYVYDNFEFK